jgi:hypothetical protein
MGVGVDVGPAAVVGNGPASARLAGASTGSADAAGVTTRSTSTVRTSAEATGASVAGRSTGAGGAGPSEGLSRPRGRFRSRHALTTGERIGGATIDVSIEDSGALRPAAQRVSSGPRVSTRASDAGGAIDQTGPSARGDRLASGKRLFSLPRADCRIVTGTQVVAIRRECGELGIGGAEVAGGQPGTT